MKRICAISGTEFEVTEADLKFYEKIAPVFAGKKYPIPPPTLCPDERQRRRLAFRNERKLYRRKCTVSGKEIISIYSEEKPFPVYSPEVWWSDQWDPRDYGRDFDFSRPFFEQYADLMRVAPVLSNIVIDSENCEYNSFCVNSRDCYLCTRVGSSEKCFYNYLSIDCLSCIDCFDIFSCQYCYECTDCWNCYNSIFCQLCKNSNDCLFCYECFGCRNCFGCIGLRNAQYCFLNQQYSKEEYEDLLHSQGIHNTQGIRDFSQKFSEELLKKPRRSMIMNSSENVLGNYISTAKNIYQGFDIENTDTAYYSWGVEYARDIHDGSFIYHGENCYENISNSYGSNILFSFGAYNSHDLYYSMLCFNNSHDCFGCFSLKNGKYCILNKQYSKEEYAALMPKIIEHMQKIGEWGEFFPVEISPFAYNETVAQEYFPLTKKEILKRGWRWKEEEEADFSGMTKRIPAKKLPETIAEIPDDILNWAIECNKTKRLFMIQKAELDFYRKMDLPIPRLHPDVRHEKRRALRNPRKLWRRNCMKCQKPIETSYVPDSPEIIYCEACYLQTVY